MRSIEILTVRLALCGLLGLALAGGAPAEEGGPETETPEASAPLGEEKPGAAAGAKPSPSPPVTADPERPPGLWWKFRGRKELSEEDRALFERLQALGYATGTVKAEAEGVTAHIPERAYGGYNFYTSGHAPEAVLMDMDGKVLHRWSIEPWEVWPDYPVFREDPNARWWRRALPYPNGDVVAIFDHRGVVKLDKDSRLLWATLNSAHHDLDLAPNGDIYVLTRDWTRDEEERLVLEDFIVVLGPDGKEKKRVSLMKSLAGTEFEKLWREVPYRDPDIFHTNTVTVLRGHAAERHPAFAAGHVFVAFYTLGVIAVVDPETERVVWAHRLHPLAPQRGQHDPRILPNGNLLVFDNHAADRRSSVLELDPVSLEVVWRYDGTPDAPFFSAGLGTAQRLPNGNTLITESDNGRALEVTPEGKIVWEFYNPHRAGENDEFIAALPEVLRLPPDFPIDWARGDVLPPPRATPPGDGKGKNGAASDDSKGAASGPNGAVPAASHAGAADE